MSSVSFHEEPRVSYKFSWRTVILLGSQVLFFTIDDNNAAGNDGDIDRDEYRS